MSEKIILFYARTWVGGGATSFSIHLYRAMQRAGINVRFYRLSEKPKEPKMLGNYEDVIARYATPEDMLKIVKKHPTLMVAAENSKLMPYRPTILGELMDAGMRVVIHDPNEFLRRKVAGPAYDYHQYAKFVYRPICIRKTMRQFHEDAVFIPHPYNRKYEGWKGQDLFHRKAGCCIARLTFIKRPMIIFQANRLVPKDMRIKFHGLENRQFTYFKLKQEYPEEYKQGSYTLPFEWGVSARMARKYTLAIDMTRFIHDGGGSQYTFMEAWDAGSINVIHRDWLRYKGEMKDGENCLTIESSEELAELIKRSQRDRKFQKELTQISVNGTDHLEKYHDPVKIAKQYYNELVNYREIKRFPRLK